MNFVPPFYWQCCETYSMWLNFVIHGAAVSNSQQKDRWLIRISLCCYLEAHWTFFNEIIFHVAPNFISTSIKVKLFFSRDVITPFSFFVLLFIWLEIQRYCFILCIFFPSFISWTRWVFVCTFDVCWNLFVNLPGVYIWKGKLVPICFDTQHADSWIM